MRKRASRPTVRKTPQVMRDWQQGENPLPTGLNASKASDWVEAILSGLNLSEGLEESRIRDGWRVVAGDFVASQTEVVSLKRKVLVLRVLQPAMRFHLEQSRGELLRKVQQELGKESVREVRLVTA